MSIAISIHDLVVSYAPGRPVIDHVTFDVKAGETFGLIGLNGQGKTTLIKTLLGLRRADQGAITIFDHPAHDDAARRRLSYLPERFDPPWFLSGLEFIRFAARFYGVRIDPNVARTRAESLGLDPDALARGVHTYSKGMRQKLGLIGTLMTGCDGLILDEPMSGLDPRARVQVKNALLAARAEGRTVFLSSHILADMDEICDRVAVLHGGLVRYLGPPQGLRAQTGDLTLEKAFLSVIEEKAAAV